MNLLLEKSSYLKHSVIITLNEKKKKISQWYGYFMYDLTNTAYIII